jgi:hypothetical protein
MARTMWLAALCLVGLGVAMALKIAAPQAALVVQPARDRSTTATAFVLNEAAKSDRLELPSTRAEAEIIVPVAKMMPTESSSIIPEMTNPEAIKQIASPHWQDANARLIPIEPPHRHLKIKASNKNANENPPKPRAEVWHCRQDAVGSLLRSLDLSPRCNL